MNANNKISNLVSTQLPFFVRNDHQNFVRFMEAYYEWLEQQDGQVNGIANTKQYNVVTRSKNLLAYQDVDRTVDQFSDELYDTFLKLIPKETKADKNIILKNVKDFYRAKGTEKSIQFLMRILFGIQDTGFYYPKKDVLRASDGKWFIEKSLKFDEVLIDGIVTENISDINKFVGLTVTGNVSGATAVVERVDKYYEGSTLIRELKISNQIKDFRSGEQVFALFTENDITKSIVANTFSGIVNSVRIVNPGLNYSVGDTINVESNTGSGALIKVDSVTTGNIRSLFVSKSGAGFKVNDVITISDITGSGATANVSNVRSDGKVHPNTYNIVISLISSEANTPIGNTLYANLNPSLSDPANDVISNSMTSFVYANTGPIIQALVITTGNNYSANPSFDTQANTRIRNLGILGKMEIIDGGQNYQIGDEIEFINVLGGYGIGAKANVMNVDFQNSNSINEVQFVEVPGHIIGGSGYVDTLTLTPKYPIANVVSSTGNGANIIVTALLGYGEEYTAISSSIGQITRLIILSGGSGYDTAPTLNLKSIGDGTAQATATIISGSFSYPGRWLNDDGHLSSYNFIQDRDYYQNFSYVVKVAESISKYREALKGLIHPSGMKLFGEYLFVDETPSENVVRFQDTDGLYSIFVSGTYTSSGNANGTTIEVTTQRDTSNVTNVYIEFLSGDTANIANGVFAATSNTSNSFIIYQPLSNTTNSTNSTGSVLTSI